MTDRATRVILVTTHYPPLVGGAATYFSLLANALARQGAEVTVLTTRTSKASAAPPPAPLIVRRVIPQLETAPAGLRKVIQVISTLFWLTILRQTFSVVHVHGSKSVTVASAMFSQLFKVPIVYDVQDFLSRLPVLRRGTQPKYIATGHPITDYLVQNAIPHESILTIPSIPPDEMRQNLPIRTQHDPIQCLFVGELHHAVKGSDILLQAFQIVHQALPSLRLDLIGDGPDRAQDQSFVRQHNLQNVVTFRGNQPPTQVREAMDQADILVLSSRTEGMPRIILEAFARALAVIATRVGGIPEAIQDGGNGVLVPPENPAELADAIRRLAKDPNLRHELGKRGRAWIETLPTWNQLASQIVSLYKK